MQDNLRMDSWFLLGVGLTVITLGLYLLRRLWSDVKGRPGLIFMVGLMVTCGGGCVYSGVVRILGQ